MRKNDKQTKKIKSTFNKINWRVALRFTSLAVLTAGVFVFGLPSITWGDVIGTISLFTLIGLVVRWIE